MGTLQRNSTGESITLRSVCVLGRSAGCDLRVGEPSVSGEHASLHWKGGAWYLRDLGSKNGTFLNERRLSAGERAPLLAGDVLGLGAPRSPAVALTLTDAGGPLVSVRNERTGEVRLAYEGLLLLPSEEAPVVTLFEGRDGQWMLESEGEARRLEARDTLRCDGDAWVVELPESSTSTLERPEGAPSLEQLALRFVVSRDEERVDLTVVCPERDHFLPSRSHHYMLVTLARARLADASAAPEERGFLERERLCRMLAMDELRLNVEVCRARKQFATLGVRGAASIIDRRSGTGRLRLGVERVEVLRAP